MTIKRIDFTPETVLTASDLEQVQDNGLIQVSTVLELDDLPDTVRAAFCEADKVMYHWNGSAWVGQGQYVNWTPAITADTTNPTNWTGTGRYTQVGKQVSGWGRYTAGTSFTVGSGNWRIPLPVAPASSTTYPLMGEGYAFGGPGHDKGQTFQLYKESGANYCRGRLLSYAIFALRPTIYYISGDTSWNYQTADIPPVAVYPQVGAYLTWNFSYEAA